MSGKEKPVSRERSTEALRNRRASLAWPKHPRERPAFRVPRMESYLSLPAAAEPSLRSTSGHGSTGPVRPATLATFFFLLSVGREVFYQHCRSFSERERSLCSYAISGDTTCLHGLQRCRCHFTHPTQALLWVCKATSTPPYSKNFQ